MLFEAIRYLIVPNWRNQLPGSERIAIFVRTPAICRACFGLPHILHLGASRVKREGCREDFLALVLAGPRVLTWHGRCRGPKPKRS